MRLGSPHRRSAMYNSSSASVPLTCVAPYCLGQNPSRLHTLVSDLVMNEQCIAVHCAYSQLGFILALLTFILSSQHNVQLIRLPPGRPSNFPQHSRELCTHHAGMRSIYRDTAFGHVRLWATKGLAVWRLLCNSFPAHAVRTETHARSLIGCDAAL